MGPDYPAGNLGDDLCETNRCRVFATAYLPSIRARSGGFIAGVQL